MNYLEILKTYTKVIEIITKKVGFDIYMENGQHSINNNQKETILIDPEFHLVEIRDHKTKESYYFDLEDGFYKNNKKITSEEFMKKLYGALKYWS